MNWQTIDWKQCYDKILKIQEQIVKAYLSNNYKLIYQLQQQLVNSWEAAALSVRKIYTNSGGKTPGLDGIIWDTPAKRFNAITQIKQILNNSTAYKPSPVKRVMINKPNSKDKRPLGIPNMIDRALQYLFVLAIDPIVECQSDKNSWGFRKYKSAQGAISKIMNITERRCGAQWIYETDIEKCFDKISHKFLLENIICYNLEFIRKWLKAGICFNKEIIETTEGTPQGSVISPMLCNIALNGLEQRIREATKADKLVKTCLRNKQGRIKYQSKLINMVRYVDDLIITARSKEILENEVIPILESFLEERGLKTKESKTKIENIFKGIDFLGFNIRRYKRNLRLNQTNIHQPDSILIVKPSKKSIAKLKSQIKLIINKHKPMEAILKELNPLLKGWTNYFAITYHATRSFHSIHRYIWIKMERWARSRHYKWNWIRIRETYLPYYNKKLKGVSKWTWGINKDQILFNISTVTKWTPSLTKMMNPYTEEGKNYYENLKIKLIETKFKSKILKKYNYRCTICNQLFYPEDIIEYHHIIPIRAKGKSTISNMQPLHQICHQQITQADKDKFK